MSTPKGKSGEYALELRKRQESFSDGVLPRLDDVLADIKKQSSRPPQPATLPAPPDPEAA
jgi:hypothetical protein